jgi:putative transferase (TIGR04331 family)
MTDPRGHGGSDRVFLATTAIEAFWDDGASLVFLSESCVRPSRERTWNRAGRTIVDQPWDSSLEEDRENSLLKPLYSRFLSLLADELNRLHGVAHSKRFWEIVVGPWLSWYIHILHHRYRQVICALEQYPHLTTLVLDEAEYIVPADTFEFVAAAQDDLYNLQLYSRLFSLLGKSYPSKKLTPDHGPLAIPRGRPRYRLVREFVGKTIRAIIDRLGLSRGTVYLHNAGFSKKAEWGLAFRSGLRVFPLMTEGTLPPMVPPDPNRRAGMRLASFETDPFHRILAAGIPADIPTCFVEGFDRMVTEAREGYPAAARAIFSAYSWYFQERFKIWAADQAEKGTLLIGTPHGGQFGHKAHIPNEDHESSILDHYVTWGFDLPDSRADIVRHLPVSKLVGRPCLGANNGLKGILYPLQLNSRYLTRYPFSADFYRRYLEWMKRFIRACGNDTRRSLLVRLHAIDCGWDLRMRLDRIDASLTYDDSATPFLDSLAKCRLLVSDYLGTTFLEALAADKPTVLFWDMQAFRFRDDALPYYRELRQAGIFHDSPESAARHLDKVYDDVASWWKEGRVQRARKQFCDRYARTEERDNRNGWQRYFTAVYRGNSFLPERRHDA